MWTSANSVGGKTLRDGMGQSVNYLSGNGELDLVITNALVLDYTGIFKADIGIKDGYIAGIGKAGNPDIMDWRNSRHGCWRFHRGSRRRRFDRYRCGIDTHIHYICPQQVDTSRSAVSQPWLVAVLVLTMVPTLLLVLLAHGTSK